MTSQLSYITTSDLDKTVVDLSYHNNEFADIIFSNITNDCE